MCGYATSYRNTYYAHRKKHQLKSASEGSTSTTIQKDSSVVSESQRVDSKDKKTSGSSRCRGKTKDSTKSSNRDRKTDTINRTSAGVGKNKRSQGMNSNISEINTKATSQISSSKKEEILKSKKLSSCNTSGDSLNIIYLVSSSSDQTTEMQHTVLPSPNDDHQHCSIQSGSLEDTLPLEPEDCYLLDPVETSVIQTNGLENIECVNEVVEDAEVESFGSPNNKCPEENGEIVMAAEKQNSCIILSSSGRCAVPTCESGDDSLLLIRVGDDSYVGVCRHHTFNDQLSESQKDDIDAARQTESVDISLQGFENVNVQIANDDQTPEDELITLTTSDTIVKAAGSLDGTDELEADLGNQNISLITLPEKYEKVQINMGETMPHVSELEKELLAEQQTPDDNNDPAKLNSNGVCPTEEFSAMIELDSGVASLSGHIVDDSLSLAQLEVICPLCDEQFLCMDAYVTHLEISHN